MKIVPITLKKANEFVTANHRHHGAVVGAKFALGLADGDKLVGCAIAGRPVARHLDNGKTLEVTRLCTDGTKNACSKLYSTAAKIAKLMGYEKIITYITIEENGASLKASGWALEKDNCGGGEWSCKSRPRQLALFPTIKKQRWVRIFANK